MIETIELMKHSQLAPSCFPRSWPKPRHHLPKLIMNFVTSCFVISFRINHKKYIVPWLDDESRILNNIQYVAIALFLLMIAHYLEDSKLNLLRQIYCRNDFNFKLDPLFNRGNLWFLQTKRYVFNVHRLLRLKRI